MVQRSMCVLKDDGLLKPQKQYEHVSMISATLALPQARQ